ncbi:LCP family protein [Kitasatospora viridis]|uniref:LytR family transcriptional attenuator n=1 Tax=Kitasatospora viridis TaxID=281105 RepID=A0A561ULE7_9ACTN|nr:LCP family protein [Kitasatospora viridis]TWG00193.1 LytR family transcriptional attenuator [Kitasatospora viridis]
MTDPEARPGKQHERRKAQEKAEENAENTSVGPDAPSAHPRRRRLAKTAGVTAAALVLATAGAGFWFYERLDGNLSIFSSAGVAGTRPPVGPADPSGNTPVNVLLLGSDSRANGNDQLAGGDIGVGNSDTAILLHVYADHRHAVAVSIPRDSLVDIPPCLLPSGRWTEPQHDQMFNSAFSLGAAPNGNPACSQNTVEALTGLRVDHTVVVDFKGFAAMTSAVGGVRVCVPNEVDSYGIHLKKGLQTVSGQSALDFVRARHGIGDGSDIGRMRRQQAFLAALAQKVQDQGFDLTTLLPLADAATRSLTVDQDLGSPMKLASFIRSLRSVRLADLAFVTAPWRYAGERVALVHPDADTLWTMLRQDRTLDGRNTGRQGPGTPAPATASPGGDLSVPITVQNGSRTPGLAVQAAQELRAKGYQNVTVDPDGIQRAVTGIGYQAGQQAAAEQLARYYPGAELRADPAVTTLTLTLGADYAATTATTATTAPGAGTGTEGTETPSPTATTPTGSVPSGITQNLRAADADPCAGLSYG